MKIACIKKSQPASTPRYTRENIGCTLPKVGYPNIDYAGKFDTGLPNFFVLMQQFQICEAAT